MEDKSNRIYPIGNWNMSILLKIMMIDSQTHVEFMIFEIEQDISTVLEFFHTSLSIEDLF